jgi:hypothetical protein
MPRYEGTNRATVDELHDQAMNELVREFTAGRRSAGPDSAVDKIDEPPGQDETG